MMDESFDHDASTSSPQQKSPSKSPCVPVQCPSFLELDVGGKLFKTSVRTLTRFPDSLLARMFSEDFLTAEFPMSPLFIDRDPEYFVYILAFLRSGTNVNLPTDTQTLRCIRTEADYFQLEDLVARIDAALTFNPFVVGDAVRLRTDFRPVIRGLERSRYVNSNPHTVVKIAYLEHCTGCRAMWDVTSDAPHHDIVPLKAPEITRWPCHACGETRLPFWMRASLFTSLVDSREISSVVGRVCNVCEPCVDVQWVVPKHRNTQNNCVTFSHHVYAHLLTAADRM